MRGGLTRHTVVTGVFVLDMWASFEGVAYGQCTVVVVLEVVFGCLP